MHGAYLPEGVRFSYAPGNRDCHLVRLRVLAPGRTNHKLIRIGEVRRCPADSPGSHEQRRWRAFSVLPEFPPVFDTHYEALVYLKQRWEAGVVIPQVRPARSPRKPPPASSPAREEEWVAWLGRDPFDVAVG